MSATVAAIPGPRSTAGQRVHGRGVATAACAHCGLPVPPGLVDAALPADRQFCCHGCQTAHDVIHACGLDRYYELLDRSGERRRAVSTSRRYAEYDDPTFYRLYVRSAASGAPAESGENQGGLLTTELFVDNVHCAACLWLLEKLPRVAPGVVESRVDLRRRAVRLTWDPAQVRLSQAAAALDALGYPPHPVRQSSLREARRAEDRRHLVRLGIAGACSGNVMLLAFALYAGLFDGMEPAYARIFSWLSLGFTMLSLAWPGKVFFKGAIAALRTRTLHLDLPIALGLGAGAVWSTWVTISDTLGSQVAGASGIYYDSLAMLVFALLIGRFIQHRQQRWAADSVELLFSLSPTSARLVDGPDVREVPVESLVPGQLVEVRAGDSFPVDGVVESGASQVDLSILTGESVPVDVRTGQKVAAGATNLSTTLRIRVEATGADTRVGRLMRLVEESSRRRAPIVQLADRMAGWFVLCMMLLATTTVAWWWPESPRAAVQNAVALLIVACPCGLGLATPLAMTVALGRAARRGLLIKGADALQILARPGTIFLDKTGTVTEGRMAVVEWHGDGSVRPLVAALEDHSTHPIARALAATEHEGIAAEVTSTIGGGVAGVVDGRALAVGSGRFMTQCGVTVDPDLAFLAGSSASRGLTPVFIAESNRCIGVACLGDPVRADARGAIASLAAAGWDVRILSGDHPAAVAAVARQLGIPANTALGGVTPEGKLEIVEQARRERPGRPVVMVGDGVNDAAALAAASVGIAVHGGAEASLTAADASVTRPGLAPLVELIAGAKRTMRTLKFNLGVSLAYNAVAAAVCMTGVVTPLLAAVLMPASSLTVLALSFRAWGRVDPRNAADTGAHRCP